MKSFFTKIGALLLCGVMFTVVGCHDYGEDIDNLNEKIENDLSTSVGDLEKELTDEIASLRKEVEDNYVTQAALKAAQDELSTVKTNAADLATAVETLENALKDANANIAGNEEAIKEAKEDADAKIKAINESIETIKATVGNNNAAIAALGIRTSTLETSVATINELINSLDETYATDAELAAVKGELELSISGLASRVSDLETGLATANETIKANTEKIGTLIADLDKAEEAIKALEDGVAKNEAAIEAHKKLIDARVETLEGSAAELKKAIDDEVADREAAVAGLQKLIDDLDATYATDADITGLQSQINTINGEIKSLKEKDDAIDGQIEALKEKLSNEYATIEALGEVKTALATAQTNITKLTTDLANLTTRVNDLANEVAGLIQNIAFVPEYEDGLATAVTLEISDASVGVGNISATTLTGVFEVTPASQADAILALWKAEETKNEVSVIVQPVQTRAAAPITVNGVSLELSAVEGQEGRLAVTAYVPMIEDYTTYKFAFAVGTKATSDYVGIYKKAGLKYSYDLVKDFDEAAGTATPVEDVVAYSHKWTQPADSDYDKEYKVAMLLDGKYYDPETVALKYGMAEDALTPELTVTDLDGASFIKLENGAIVNVADAPGMYNYIGQTNSFKARYNLFGSEVLTHVYEYTITGVRFEDNTYYIDEADDLFWVADNEATVASQGADLFFNTDVDIKTDLARYNNVSTWKPVDNWNPIDLEQAIVDGNGKTVSNFAVEADANYAGLFGYIKGGTVKNITVADATVKAPAFVGAVIGGMDGTEEMTNCHAQNVTVTAYVDGGDCGNHAGAVAGYLNSDKDGITFDNITATGSRVYAYRDVAGLVGTADVKEIRNSRLATTVVFLDRRPAYGEVKDKNHNFLVGRVLEGANEVATTTTVDKASEWAAPVMNDGVLADNTESRLYEIHAYGAWLNVTNETQVLEVFNSNGLGFFSSKATEYGSEAKKAVRFTSDIDMSSVARGDDAAFYAFKPINNWVGEVPVAIDFDGCNRTIENLTINTPDAKNVAIFGHYCGDIKNVVVDNADFTGLGRVAGIAAQHWGKIEGCTVKNSTFVAKPADNDDGDKVGAIVAQQQDNTDAYILGCKVENVDIYGFRNLGAFAGHSEVTEFSNNTAKDVNIYIDQVTMPYGDYVPFATEHDFVGRNDNGVAIADEDTSNDIKVYNYEYTADEISDQQDFMTLREADKTLVTEVATVEALNLFAADHRNAAKFWTTFAGTEINNNVRLSGDSYELTGLWKPVGSAFADCYLGTFNGNNKPITGLHVNTLEAAGFFGCVLGSVKNMNIIEPEIYSSHWGAAVVAVLYGEVDGCTVTGGQVVVAPNNEDGEWDNGDKAGAIAGYVAANGGGLDRVTNNTADGVTIKAFRSLGAIVGCMDNLDDDKDAFAGNVAKNCEVIVDRVTGVTDENRVNIGLVMGRFNDEDAADLETVKNGCTVDNVKLYKVTTTGTQALATSPKVGNNGVEVLN